MAVKFNSKEKADEYLRSLREPPTVVPSAPPRPPAPKPEPKAENAKN